MALNEHENLAAAEVVVRPLELKDVQQMCQWGTHEDLRYLPYNFPYKRPLDLLFWYKSKKRPFKRYIFGAFIGEELIGYITLKQIKWVKREAFMGIAFNPSLVGNGYGTAALNAYLELVRKRYGMKRIFLKTACFNLRGQRCYQKVGFVEVERRLEPYEDQSQPFTLMLNYGDFTMVDDEIWTEYIYMAYDLGVRSL
jgi:RimJ/RimL family protein N-acetyltransferase